MVGRPLGRCWMVWPLWLLALPALAAAPLERGYLFKVLDNESGLAQNSANVLLQDSFGFVWIGSQGGLQRFDGHSLMLLEHRPGHPRSLPGNFVTALAEDDRGNLWIGANSASLARFDLAAGLLHTHDGVFAAVEPPLREVTALAWQSGVGLWIGDPFGVLLLPQDGEKALRMTGDAPRRIHRLVPLADGGVLAASSDGVLRVEPTGDVRVQPGSEGRSYHAVLVRASGEMVAGGGTGLDLLLHDSVAPVPMPIDEGGKVVALAEDLDGRLWVGLSNRGLLRLAEDAPPLHLVHDRYEPGGLPENEIAALMVDRNGLLWVGGFARGAARTPARGSPFRYLAARVAPQQPLLGNNVRALAEDAAGGMWIGFDGDGLLRLGPDRASFEDYAPALAAALADDQGSRRVQALLLDPAAGLWVGTTRGLLRLDPVTGEARMRPLQPGENDAAAEANVRSLLLGDEGSLWVGTFSDGVVRLFPDGQRASRLRHDPGDPDSLSHDMVLVLHQAPGGAVFAGTFDGLNRIDPGSGRVMRIRHDPEDPESLSGNLVRALHSDRSGRLWVGTHSGLNRLDAIAEGRARFTRFPPPGGEIDGTIYGILEDDAGHLWLSSNRGLLRFDPSNGRFQAFLQSDGVQSLEFNGGALLRRSDGRLAFGGTRGVTEFHPADIRPSQDPIPVHITSVRVGAERRELVSGLAPETVEAGHADRVLSIGFAALEFLAPERIQYAWRLDGFDSDWNEAGNRREATYTNLAPGAYRFRVRAGRGDGSWFPDEASIELRLAPPWWSSAPMRAAYAAALAAALALVWRTTHRRRLLREQYAAQLREREDRLKLALWGSGDEFWDWDVANNRFYRLGADQLLGFVETEQQMSSDEWRRHAVHPEDRERVERILAEHLAGRSDYFESEHRIRGASGGWVWVRSRGKVVERDGEGRPLRICGTARNITDSRRAERERRIAAEVIRSMSEGVSVVDLGFRFVSVNPAFTRITGFTAEEVLGEDAGLLNGPQHSAEEYRQIREELERTGHWHGELWQRRKDGEDILCWLESTEVRDARGNRTHYVAVLTDITDRKRAEQELRYLANYDTLTGLPNRTLLGERLAHAVIRARRQTTKIAVLFLDLDRFKHVNDSMGHAMGDRLLKAAGARLRLTVRDTDTVARLGGDEFTVVLEDIHTVTQAERVAQKILESFSQPLELDGRQDVVISPSIGIALYPDHGQVPTDLLKFADTAMYQAKDRGRNTYQVYAETMDAEARLRATMVGALRRALDRNEFRLVYQPKLSLLDDSFTGVEALLRWDSEELGPIPPATFIPLAEETGLIVAIGEWVLREACTQLLKWEERGLGQLTVAVNVSVLQLFRGELSERLCEIVREYGVAPERLELELTESMVMANAEQSINTLRSLKAIGVNLAIDDFGTGYSSLAYLKRLPIDTLKIDKEFVGDITTDPDDEAITATIIAMAHSLGLNVVAEGVETEEQLLYLREQRCDEVQGFWLSAPLEAERCTAFLLSRQRAQQRRRRTVKT
jgi:diguanylate cyclase (GGDEF)-like protein/PAS domain S-box-containing protein